MTALGLPCAEVWPEIWDTIGPMLERAREQGEAVPADDLLLTHEPRGYPEECYFSFSYGPVRDETGGVGGIYCPVIETTKRVLSERRSKFLLDLEERLRALSDPLEIKSARERASRAAHRRGAGRLCRGGQRWVGGLDRRGVERRAAAEHDGIPPAG